MVDYTRKGLAARLHVTVYKPVSEDTCRVDLGGGTYINPPSGRNPNGEDAVLKTARLKRLEGSSPSSSANEEME